MPKWILRGARLRRLWSASITHLSWDQEVTDKGGKHIGITTLCLLQCLAKKVALELFADFHKLTKEVQEDLLQSCICSETETFLELLVWFSASPSVCGKISFLVQARPEYSTSTFLSRPGQTWNAFVSAQKLSLHTVALHGAAHQC